MNQAITVTNSIMVDVISDETPNAETILAIEEVQQLKENPKKTYGSFAELLVDMDNE